MKRLFISILLPMITVMSVLAMSDSRIRETARFLTDRMAYELKLSPAQYEDCFEVNYDFILEANVLMDDVVYGYSDAIDTYYDYLDYRNEDLRYILNATQYGIFLGLDYFFRPIYTTARRWAFRIYDVYHNHHYYYYGVPACYHTYHGLHSRHHHHHGYYVARYSHPLHHEPVHIHHGNAYATHRHNDFGDRYRVRDNGKHRSSRKDGPNHRDQMHKDGQNHGNQMHKDAPNNGNKRDNQVRHERSKNRHPNVERKNDRNTIRQRDQKANRGNREIQRSEARPSREQHMNRENNTRAERSHNNTRTERSHDNDRSNENRGHEGGRRR